MKFLVERGANVNKVNADGRSALLTTASNSHLPIVEYHIEHRANINQTNKWNKGLLLHLLLKGHFAVADTLL
jgi:ankyrin repeat protein